MLGHGPLSAAGLSSLPDAFAEGSGAGTVVAGATASAVGQTLFTQGAGSSTATASSSGAAAGVKLAVASTSSAAETAVAIQAIKPIVAASAAAATSNFKLGNRVDGIGSATVSTTASATSTVQERIVSASATGVVAGTGAWDGPSGGDALTTAAGGAAATGRALALAQAASTTTSLISGVAAPLAPTTASGSATSTTAAYSVVVKPMYGNGIAQWYDQATAAGISAPADGTVVVAGAAIADCTWLIRTTAYSSGFVEAAAASTGVASAAAAIALHGDAIAVAAGTSLALATGVEDLHAASIGAASARVFARFYSVDGRQNRGVSAVTSAAVGAGEYSVAPHYIAAYFESTAIAELYGESTAAKEAVGTATATSRAYSFRGELYDVSKVNILHVNTSQEEVWVYIGDHHVG